MHNKQARFLLLLESYKKEKITTKTRNKRLGINFWQECFPLES